MTKAQFSYFQRSFFKHLTTGFNPVTFQLTEIVTTHAGGALDKFVGDGERTDGKSYSFRALFRRMVSEQDRKKYGVSADVSVVVFISPLEVLSKMGTKEFPEYFKENYSGFQASFSGKDFQIDRMQMLEEFFTVDEIMCMAYQFDLKRDSGY